MRKKNNSFATGWLFIALSFPRYSILPCLLTYRESFGRAWICPRGSRDARFPPYLFVRSGIVPRGPSVTAFFVLFPFSCLSYALILVFPTRGFFVTNGGREVVWCARWREQPASATWRMVLGWSGLHIIYYPGRRVPDNDSRLMDGWIYCTRVLCSYYLSGSRMKSSSGKREEKRKESLAKWRSVMLLIILLFFW